MSRGYRLLPPAWGHACDAMPVWGRARRLRPLQTLRWSDGPSVLIMHTVIFLIYSTPHHFTFHMKRSFCISPSNCAAWSFKCVFFFKDLKWNIITNIFEMHHFSTKQHSYSKGRLFAVAKQRSSLMHFYCKNVHGNMQVFISILY